MSTKDRIQQMKKAALTGTVMLSTLIGSEKAFAQAKEGDLNQKNKIIPEQGVTDNKPAYLDYRLSFEERKAALDKAVENGEITIVKDLNKRGMPLYCYFDIQKNKVAEAYYVDKGGNFIFYSTSPMQYMIHQKKIPFEVQEEGMAKRFDNYTIKGNESHVESAEIKQILLKNEKHKVDMSFYEGELVHTTIEDGNTTEIFDFKSSWGAYILYSEENGIRTRITQDENGNVVRIIKHIVDPWRDSEFTDYFYNDEKILTKEEKTVFNEDGSKLIETKVYDYEMLKTTYPYTLKKYQNNKLIESISEDAIGSVVFDLKYDLKGRISEMSYKDNQKAIFLYEGNENVLTGINYQNGSNHKEIMLKEKIENADRKRAIEGYARLAQNNIHDITPKNIDKKVVESYIASGDVPSEDSYFYTLYQQMKQQNEIIKFSTQSRGE